MTDALLTRIKIVFTVGVILVLATLFTFGILLRDQEVALLGSMTRFVSSIGYRMQYALGSAGQMAGVAVFGDARPAEAEGPARAVPVLVYHGIVAQSDRFSLTERAFADQLFALKRAGYTTITTEELLAFLRGEQELPEKSFLLTFDDGRRDSYERADPILEALGYTAVMFVATDASIDAPSRRTHYYLRPDELARMQESGRWELASHARQTTGGTIAIDAAGTKGNFLSNRAWREDEQRLETLSEYQARLEDELGGARESLTRSYPSHAPVFSYPFGDYGQQGVNEPDALATIRALVAEHYDAAFKQVWPLDSEYTMNFPGDDVYQLRRIEVETDWDGKRLLTTLEGAAPKPLPYEESYKQTGAWKFNWGTVALEEEALALRASHTSTGGFAFLDGTRDWTDYTYTTRVENPDDVAVSLAARYGGEEHMVLCSFFNGMVRLEERINGVAYTEEQEAAVIPREATLGIRVEGATAACLYNGEELVSGAIDRRLATGGIGIRVWDDSIARAHATFSDIRVTPL